MNPKIYVYKMVVDNGGAPCVWHGLLSLAICKPMIRKSAGEGDFIIGFGGRSRFPKEPLIYIAKVTAKPKVGDYYTLPKYENRPDCIYHEVDGEVRLKADAHFHNKSNERKKDVGLHFENAHVLLSNCFRYFGDEAKADYKNQFPLIKDMVEKLRQGARVNHPPERYDELNDLMSQTWRNNSEKKLPNQPIQTEVWFATNNYFGRANPRRRFSAIPAPRARAFASVAQRRPTIVARSFNCGSRSKK